MLRCLVVWMILACSSVAFSTPKPILARFAAPKRNRKVGFASKAGEFHQRYCLDEFQLPLMHKFLLGCLFSLLRATVVLRVILLFLFPEATFADNMVLALTTFKINIVYA